jgi:hypothetical protein
MVVILDTPASTTSPGTGTTISWSWGKDHVNGSLGSVALMLTNANKSLLAEDALREFVHTLMTGPLPNAN